MGNWATVIYILGVGNQHGLVLIEDALDVIILAGYLDGRNVVVASKSKGGKATIGWLLPGDPERVCNVCLSANFWLAILDPRACPWAGS